MNNQFATQRLLEEIDEFSSLENILAELGASKDTIEMLVNAVRQEILSPQKVIDIVRSILETSSVGGGTTAGASFTPGTGEQMATTRAFGKKKYQEDAPMLAGGKKANISTYTQDGFEKAPSKEAAAKQIKGVEVKDLWEEGNQPEYYWYCPHCDAEIDSRNVTFEETHDSCGTKVEERQVPLYNDWEENINPHSIVVHLKNGKKLVISKKHLKGSTPMYNTILKAFRDDRTDITNAVISKMLGTVNTPLNESRAYNQFKKETALRPKSEQLHQAAKMISQKLQEVDKLLEFTSQMRQELSEGEQTVEYKTNTKKIFEKINSKVIEVYTKVKSLK